MAILFKQKKPALFINIASNTNEKKNQNKFLHNELLGDLSNIKFFVLQSEKKSIL